MVSIPSRHTMRGLLAWGVLLLVIVGSAYYYFTRKPATDASLSQRETAALDSFSQAIAADTLAQREAWENRFSHKDYPYKKRRGYSPRVVETFPFDPNHCDSVTFLRLGLRPWQAHNALQYRRNGGKWRSAEHFSKLYGLSAEDYQRLAPYIRIDGKSSQTAYRPASSAASESAGASSYPEKYKPGSVTLNLNECDTTELRRIPEIGPYRASQIVKYREALGGFVSVSQLSEIKSLPAGIEKWFTVDAGEVQEQLDLNKATFQALMRHPYINYEQAREIMNFRRRYGGLTSLSDLRLSPYFTASDLSRLEPYVVFE